MKNQSQTREPFMIALRKKLGKVFVDFQTKKTSPGLIQNGFTSDSPVFQLAMAALPEPILVINKDFVIAWMNQAAKKLSLGADRPLRTLCYECQHRKAYPCHIDGETCALQQISETRLPMTIIHQHYASNGERRDVEIISAPLLSKDGSFEGIVQSLRDVTERKRLEKKLHELAITDELTGLYNRRGFFTIAEKQLKTARRLKKEVLLLSADLDGLKEINDKFGHQDGDSALIEVATVLKESFRESDVIARIGGDEFVVFQIENIEKSPELLIARLQEKLDLRNNTGGKYLLSASIGIAHADPESTFSIEELLSKADKFMYEKKKHRHLLPHQQQRAEK